MNGLVKLLLQMRKHSDTHHIYRFSSTIKLQEANIKMAQISSTHATNNDLHVMITDWQDLTRSSRVYRSLVTNLQVIVASYISQSIVKIK